jgi:hypothetical protein
VRLQLSRRALVALVLVAAAVRTARADGDTPVIGAVQQGVYLDSDHTRVWHTLGELVATWGAWTWNNRLTTDAVTSASIDVRSSPQIDAVTNASRRPPTERYMMEDYRWEYTTGGGWNDGHGRTLDANAAFAQEHDYTSVSGGLDGSIDLDDRTLTVLTGANVTDNWVASFFDPTFHRKMFATGWTAGAARVLTPDDALRVRYDGRAAFGYQASPYRYVRFGPWSTSVQYNQQLIFMNTIGSPDGLPELVPERRVSHALVLEWVHALADHVSLHPSVRAGHDSWGVDSLTAAVDLRVVLARWRLELGYRYYAQRAASFFEGQYVNDPSTYTYYTSNKELGDERGHLGSIGVSLVLHEPSEPGARRLLLDARVDAFHYAYPGYGLLPERSSLFANLGLTFEH